MDVPEKDTPKLFTLVAELEQLEQDCGPIDYNSEKDAISIVTESIELEEVYLGSFKIELHLKQLKDLYKDSPYYVIALDPNPAAVDSNVTHPHVSSEKVCEGDGSVTIRAALEQGRLSDFFTIVTSILNTYNPDSPYVNLHEWDGTPCYDCGYTMSSDNSYFCPFCDYDYCEECSTYCRSCDETTCLSCANECPVCGEMVW